MTTTSYMYVEVELLPDRVPQRPDMTRGQKHTAALRQVSAESYSSGFV